MYDRGQCTGAGASFHVASSVPADGAMGVELKAAITVTFDAFPDPATVAYPAVTLRSGANSFDYDAHVDLLNKALVIVPKSPLTPNTQYVLQLATGGHGLQSLACGQLAGSGAAQIGFTTGTTIGTGPPPPPVHRYATDVGPILTDAAKGCVAETCHATVKDPMSGVTYTPALGMELASTAMVQQTALGVTASEDPSLPRIKGGDPANSYLLRKLLGTPDMVANRMPVGQVLDQATLQIVSDWILEGAP
jgi:hypothetical protein